jgi:hypothetical protein
MRIAMPKGAVGFYWTQPVPWARFTALPQDVEAAAKASRTIRYQREAVHREARKNHWELVDEVVYLELRRRRHCQSTARRSTPSPALRNGARGSSNGRRRKP